MVSRIATRRTQASGRSYLATRGQRVSARAKASWAMSSAWYRSPTMAATSATTRP